MVDYAADTVTSNTFTFSGTIVTRRSHLPAPTSYLRCVVESGAKPRTIYDVPDHSASALSSPGRGDNSSVVHTDTWLLIDRILKSKAPELRTFATHARFQFLSFNPIS